MADWKSEFIESLISGPHGSLLLLTQYGSRKEPSDLDYFALFEGVSIHETLIVAGIDLLAVSRDVLIRHLRVMDPLFTEPFLTGNLLFGDSAIRDKLLSNLHSFRATQEVIRYLLSRSFQEYNEAYRIGLDDKETHFRMERHYWSTLSFSIGYWCFASYYKHRQDKVARLTEVVDSMTPQLKLLWMEVIDAKETRAAPSLELLSRWADFLLTKT